MNKVMIMETMGDLVIGQIMNTDEFKFLYHGQLLPIDNLYYIDRDGFPIPLKDKHGLIIWAKHRDWKPFVQVRLLGDDGK